MKKPLNELFALGSRGNPTLKLIQRRSYKNPKKSQFFLPLATFQIEIFLKEWIWEFASFSCVKWCLKKGLGTTCSFPRTVFLRSISEIKRAVSGRHSLDSTTKQNFKNKFIWVFNQQENCNHATLKWSF